MTKVWRLFFKPPYHRVARLYFGQQLFYRGAHSSANILHGGHVKSLLHFQQCLWQWRGKVELWNLFKQAHGYLILINGIFSCDYSANGCADK